MRRESLSVVEIAVAISTANSLRHSKCARIGERGSDVFLFCTGGIDQPRPPDHQREASAEHRYTLSRRRYFTAPAIPTHDASKPRICIAGGQRRRHYLRTRRSTRVASTAGKFCFLVRRFGLRHSVEL